MARTVIMEIQLFSFFNPIVLFYMNIAAQINLSDPRRRQPSIYLICVIGFSCSLVNEIHKDLKEYIMHEPYFLNAELDFNDLFPDNSQSFLKQHLNNT